MKPRPWLRRAGWLVVLGCVVHWIPVGGVPLARLQYEIWSDDSRFCARCHVMETRHAAWQRSAHAQAAECMDCHAEPGVIGSLIAHLQGSRYVWALITGERSGTVLKAHVSDATCLQCHTDVATRAAPDVHAHHRALALTCTECHTSATFHPTRSQPPPATDRAACTRCHPWSNVPAVAQRR